MCKSAWKPPLVSTEQRKGKSVAFPDIFNLFDNFQISGVIIPIDNTDISMSCNSARVKYPFDQF